MTTIMVSPMARLTASRMPPMMPGSAAGRSTLRHRLRAVAPMASEPSRMRPRHGLHRVVGERGDEGDDHDAHDAAGGERAVRRDGEADQAAEPADRRRDGQHGEEAVDDGRDAGEDLEDRLDDGAHRGVGIFDQIDRR